MADSYFLGILIAGPTFNNLTHEEQERNYLDAKSRALQVDNWWYGYAGVARPSFTPPNLVTPLPTIANNVLNIMSTNIDAFNIMQATEPNQLLISSAQLSLETAYDGNTIYEVGDKVSYDDRNWICVYPICIPANNTIPGTASDPIQWVEISRYEWEFGTLEISDTDLVPAENDRRVMVLTGNADGSATISSVEESSLGVGTSTSTLPILTTLDAGKLLKVNSTSDDYELQSTIATNVIVLGDGTGGLKGSAIVWDVGSLPAVNTTMNLTIITDALGEASIGYTAGLPNPNNLSLNVNRTIGVNATADNYEFKAAIDNITDAGDLNKLAYVRSVDTANGFGTIGFDTASNLGLASGGGGTVPDPATADANRVVGLNNAGDAYEYKMAMDTVGTNADVNKIAYISAVDTTNNFGTISYDTASNLGLDEVPDIGSGDANRLVGANNAESEYELKMAMDTVSASADVNKIAYVRSVDTANNYGTIGFATASTLGLSGGGGGGGSASPYFYGYGDSQNSFEILSFNRESGDDIEAYDIKDFEGYCTEYANITFSRDATDPRTLLNTYVGNFTVNTGVIGIALHNNYSDWDMSTDYAIDARVLHNNLLWEAESANTGSEPTVDNANWRQYFFNYGEVIPFGGSSYVSTMDDNENMIGDLGAGQGWRYYAEGAGATAISSLFTGTSEGAIITSDATSTATALDKGPADSLLTAQSSNAKGLVYRVPSAIHPSHQVDSSIPTIGFNKNNYQYMMDGSFLCIETGQSVAGGCIEGASMDSPTGKNRYKMVLSLKHATRHAVLALDYNGVAYLCENGNTRGRWDSTANGGTINSYMYGNENTLGSLQLDLRPITWFIDNGHLIKDINMNFYDVFVSNNGINANWVQPSTRIFSRNVGAEKSLGTCFWFITSANKMFRLARGDSGPIIGINNVNSDITDTVPFETLDASTSANSATEFINDRDHLGMTIWYKTAETTGNIYRGIGQEGGFRSFSIYTATGLPNIEDDPVVKIVAGNTIRNFRDFFRGSQTIADATATFSAIYITIAFTESGNCYWLGTFPLLGGTFSSSSGSNQVEYGYSTRTSSFTLINKTTHFDDRFITDVKISTTYYKPTVIFKAVDNINDTNGYVYTAGGLSNLSLTPGRNNNYVLTSAVGRGTLSNTAYSAPEMPVIEDNDGNDIQGNITDINIDTTIGAWTSYIDGSYYHQNQISGFMEAAILKDSNNKVYMPHNTRAVSASAQGLDTWNANNNLFLGTYTKNPTLDGTSLGGYRPVQGLENKAVTSVSFASNYRPLVVYDDGTTSIGNAYASVPNLSTTSTSWHQDPSVRYAAGRARSSLFNSGAGEPGIFKLRPLRIA